MRKNLILTFILLLTAGTALAQETYEMVGPVQYPDSLENKPGYLSVKGKVMYMPLTSAKGNSEVYACRRKKLGKVFDKFLKVDGLPNNVTQCVFDKKETTVVYISNTSNIWEDNDLSIATRKNSKSPFTDARKLDEVNAPGISDAYPFLTADGLNLYFFRNGRECYLASREKTDEPFGAPQKFTPVNNLLDTSGTGNGVNIWMDKKQKTLMVFDGEKVYRSTRKKTKEAFTAFELYITAETFTNLELDFLSGITFTQDLSEFYIYHSPADQELPNQLLWFRKAKY